MAFTLLLISRKETGKNYALSRWPMALISANLTVEKKMKFFQGWELNFFFLLLFTRLFSKLLKKQNENKELKQ